MRPSLPHNLIPLPPESGGWGLAFQAVNSVTLAIVTCKVRGPEPGALSERSDGWAVREASRFSAGNLWRMMQFFETYRILRTIATACATCRTFPPFLAWRRPPCG